MRHERASESRVLGGSAGWKMILRHPSYLFCLSACAYGMLLLLGGEGSEGSGSTPLCNRCPPGTFSNSSNPLCSSCGSGHCENITDCEECPEGTYSDVNGSSLCTPCENGTFANATRSTNCTRCPKGHYAEDTGMSECEPCPLGQYGPLEGSIECLNCSYGMFANETGSINCTMCPRGHYSNMSGSIMCEECDRGTYSNRTGTTKCWPCTPGSYCNDTGCFLCTACEPGYAQRCNQSTKCDICSPGSYSSGNASNCSTCPTGKICNETGCILCEFCDGGHEPFTSYSCQQCSAGTYRPDHSSNDDGECQDCKTGYFQDHPGQTSCELCPEHQYCPLCKDMELRGQLEQLKCELAPLEKKYLKLVEQSSKHRDMMAWGGLSWMSLQFGFLSYLVFWEYDWDIMEPVTYFVGYGTSLLLFTYFILTRQEYGEVSSHDRYYLNFFHRRARKEDFNAERYNQLKEAVAGLRQRMDKLHDPLLLNLPSPSHNTHT